MDARSEECFKRPDRAPRNHDRSIKEYTVRWVKVLRHDIGGEKAPNFDELGWVSVEEFVNGDCLAGQVKGQD